MHTRAQKLPAKADLKSVWFSIVPGRGKVADTEGGLYDAGQIHF